MMRRYKEEAKDDEKVQGRGEGWREGTEKRRRMMRRFKEEEKDDEKVQGRGEG